MPPAVPTCPAAGAPAQHRSHPALCSASSDILAPRLSTTRQVRGATAHFDAVVGAATSGVLGASTDSGVPVIFCVMTTDTMEQARAPPTLLLDYGTMHCVLHVSLSGAPTAPCVPGSVCKCACVHLRRRPPCGGGSGVGAALPGCRQAARDRGASAEALLFTTVCRAPWVADRQRRACERVCVYHWA